MPKVLKTKNLTKYYSRGKILGAKDVNIEVSEGEVFGFLGPNGAGKSTTIRLLLDLIRPTSGTAKIFGLDVNRKTLEIREDVGYLPGEVYLPENMTGNECLNYYKNFRKNIDQKYIDKLVHKFDLNTKKLIRTYSKGNRQKLAIIIVMMHKPKLLILDEPTSSLDPLNQQHFYDSISELKNSKTTVFFSTHILSEAEKICDRIGIIKEGFLKEVKSVQDFHKGTIRKIIVQTKSKIPFDELDIEGYEKNETGYILTTQGENGELLKTIMKYPVDDIRIEKPTLEEVFMQYYE